VLANGAIVTVPALVSDDADDTEVRRMDALERLHLLDTAPEPAFDDVVKAATRMLHVPIALITLVDRDRQWFKARQGLARSSTSREVSICSRAIEDGAEWPFVVRDAATDERFASNPLVTGSPHIRFYAGQPVRTTTGERIGTLCVIDTVPRNWTQEDGVVLHDLATAVEDLIARHELQRSIEQIRVVSEREKMLRDTMHDGLIIQDSTGRIVDWNPAAERVLGLSGDELAGRTSFDPTWRAVHVDGSIWPGTQHPAMEALRTGQMVRDATMGVHRPGQGLAWLRVNSTPIVEPNREASGVMTTFADITGLIEAEQRHAADNERSTTETAPTAAPEIDFKALLDVLDQYAIAMDATTTAIHRDRQGLDALRREIRNGGNLSEFIAGSSATGERSNLTAAITTLEERRRVMRLHLFRALTAHGQSIGEIARTWGISRQLTSRILRESTNLEPHNLQPSS
jgi:PAS domain S-box-containing protein